MEQKIVKRYRVAHSPDADDIAMFGPVQLGWVDVGGGYISLSATTEDIETLNQKSLEGVYDITAISFGVYPFIKESYALLRTGVSFGYGYGPKLVKRKGAKLRRRFKVALSGEFTSNALIFKIAYPDARPVYMRFDQIEEAVLKGEVEAGVLIHESILKLHPELEVERELWELWVELVGEELPLPLGGMAIRRSIPLWTALQIEEGLKRGVELNYRCRGRLVATLTALGKLGGDEKLLDRYLEMYAGERSVQMGERELKGVETLYQLGYRAGLLPAMGPVELYLLPESYRELRLGRV